MKDLSKPSSSKRKRRGDPNPSYQPASFLGENPFLKKGMPPSYFLPPRDFLNKYEFPSMEDEEEEVHLFYQHLDGMMGRENPPIDSIIMAKGSYDPNLDIRSPNRIAQIQQMSDSSEEDEEDDFVGRDED